MGALLVVGSVDYAPRPILDTVPFSIPFGCRTSDLVEKSFVIIDNHPAGGGLTVLLVHSIPVLYQVRLQMGTLPASATQ